MRIDIAQLEFIDPTLRKVALWLEEKTGIEFTVTSLYRMDDDGVHGQLPLRGIDLRMRNQEVGESFEKLVNGNWQYDFKRPSFRCARLHGKDSNLHLHLQSHPNTAKRF